MPLEPYMLFDFDHVRAAIQLVEDAIAHAQDQTSQAIRAVRPKIPDLARAAVEGAPQLPADRIFNSGLAFPAILRRSLMISICSHTEHVLQEWCSLLRDEWQLPELPKRRPYARDCMAYLHEAVGLALGDFASWAEWQTIETYQLARNRLAHTGGAVEDEAEQELIARLPHVSIDRMILLLDTPTIYLDVGACEVAVDAAEAFFGRLFALVQQDPRASQPGAP